MTFAAESLKVLEELREAFAAQEDRLFLWCPVALALGVIVYFLWPVEPVLVPVLAILVLILPFLVWAWMRQHDHGFALFRYLFLFGGFLMVLGFALSVYSARILGTPMLDRELRIVNVTGAVLSIDPQGQNRGSKVILGDLSIEGIAPDKTPRKIRIRFMKDDGIEAGATITFRARLSPPSGAVLPNAYDFRRHLFFEGIGAVGFSYDAPRLLAPPEKGHVTIFFEKLRYLIHQKIVHIAAPSAEGLMVALITGQRGGISENDEEAMRDSGLAHLISISGTHISMVAFTLFFFSRLFMALSSRMALYWPIKKIAAVIAMAGTVFYTFLAGAEVPAIRAMVMTSLVLLAILFDRSPFSLRLIAFATICILIVQPASVMGVSFQMSFAAVAALICFYEETRLFWRKHNHGATWVKKAGLYIIGLLITSLIAGGMTGLFGLYHFQQFALYGVLSNMIAVPLTGFVIMPAALLSLFLMPFGLEGVALKVMEWGTLWLLSVAHWTAGMAGAVIHVHQWPPVTLALLAAGTVLTLLWHGIRGRMVGAGIILVAVLWGQLSPMPDIMLAKNGDMIGIHHQNKLYVTNTRGQGFIRDNWMRLIGQDGARPKRLAYDADFASCDPHGCRLSVKGQMIALSYDAMAVDEDCGAVDLMIARIPARFCDDPNVIDRYDVTHAGSMAIYLSNPIRIIAVNDKDSMRPWGIKPQDKD